MKENKHGKRAWCFRRQQRMKKKINCTERETTTAHIFRLFVYVIHMNMSSFEKKEFVIFLTTKILPTAENSNKINASKVLRKIAQTNNNSVWLMLNLISVYHSEVRGFV